MRITFSSLLSLESVNILVFFKLLIFLKISNAILTTGNEYKDITLNRNFGCLWEGGTVPAVICTCREDAADEEMYITANSIPSYETSKIEIRNCKKLKFGSRSVVDMRNLRVINLINISSLEFDTNGINWYGYRERNQYDEVYDLSVPSLKIIINNCNITKISSYTFEGRINLIHFNHVIIDNIEPFAFTSLLQTQNIIFENSYLKNLRLQPLKKFTTENLILNNVKADLIPSRFFSNITINEKFIIINCMFDIVRSGAFLVYNPKNFEVTQTKIQQLDGEAFKVITRGNVLFKNNEFMYVSDGAFSGILPNDDEIINDLIITFDSNLFTYLTRNSLKVINLIPKFTNLKINETCNCNKIHYKDKDFYSDIKCIYNNDFVTIGDYHSKMCTIIASYSTAIIIVGVIFVLSVIVCSVLIIYYKKIYKTKKYSSDTDAKKKGNLSLIVPDGRTYRETELHVIVERADLLTTDL